MKVNAGEKVLRSITKGEVMVKDCHYAKVRFGLWALVMASVFCGMMLLPAARSEAAVVKLSELKKATYVGMDTCATCHENEARAYKLSSHARQDIKSEDGATGCEMCHGPGSLHVDAGGGKGKFIIDPGKNPETCFKCHMEKRAEFRLPYHHPVLEGKMSCSDCHDLHGNDAKPWSATSMDGVNAVCLKCHKDQEGPFVYEHPALREGCSTCHKVHGSINNKMLLAGDANLCLKCHAQADFPNIAGGGHSSRLGRATCWSGGCHEHPHWSNFSSIFFYP